jgi:hypothetical protein
MKPLSLSVTGRAVNRATTSPFMKSAAVVSPDETCRSSSRRHLIYSFIAADCIRFQVFFVRRLRVAGGAAGRSSAELLPAANIVRTMASKRCIVVSPGGWG